MAIRILHVIDTLDYGGAERFLVGLVRHLDRERFRPQVVWVTRGGPFVRPLEDAGIPVKGLAARHHRDVRALGRLVRLMRDEAVDVVHTHLFVDGFYGRLAAVLAGVPVRLVTQQNAYEDPRHRLPRWQIWVNRLLTPFTTYFVAVSEAARAYLQTVEWVPPTKVQVIPNAIDVPPPPSPAAVQALRRDWAVHPTAPLVGTVARLEPQKGLDVLLAALPRVREAVPDVRCVIVGQGALRDALAAQARALGVADAVIFAGPREDVWTVLAALDVFVLPSRFEGLSLALLEAMAAGKPVVATAVSGSVEVVEDGVTGVLVPPNDPEALARGLIHVLGSPDVARRLGEAGRRRVVQRYTLPTVARAYEALYERLLRRGRPDPMPD